MKPIKESVGEYLEALEASPDAHSYRSEPAFKEWNSILESGGYIRVVHNTNDNSRQAAQWCREKFGADHYYWTGGAFWFEQEEHVAMFMLRWL